ncbi:Suppressor of glycerol defect protein 1 [Psilocybe cubensis]|uniref:Suppressor of glycerol defect protein 1 n=2 Tax=Psilocybe cubensis TaxID=181762 RepID=A0ACB8H0X5_PSICU|nr:Suppressor of glycerol defect protein 1 [Psilocybe cubensis]KAH9481342.1 Suppressor of glycerol defect protein 1 [Psilocybe cubensis]
MPIRKKTSTTKLPQILQQQLEGITANDQPQNWRFSHSSRKEARKKGRAIEKQKRAEYFAQAKNLRKRAAEEEHAESPQHKKVRQTGPQNHSNRKVEKTPSVLPLSTQKLDPSHSKPVVEPLPSKLPKTSAVPKVPKKVLVQKTLAEDKEDKYIAFLESKLGIKRGAKRKIKSAEEDDGLDDLMDWADSFLPSHSESKAIDEKDESDSEDEEDETPESEYLNESEGNDFEEEEWHGVGHDDSDEESVTESEGETTAPPAPTPPPKGAYIPPHLRNTQPAQKADSEEIQKLTRQLKGLLNRMTEQNIASIVDSFEGVYREHRRNDVTSTTTTLIINGISSHSSLLDSYVVIYAAFVSSLYKVVGIEFAAHFVQATVSSYEQRYKELRSSVSTDIENNGKECSNLLVLISELYNFQVVSAVLVFDIIRALLADELTEVSVELLLKIVRNSGQQLRQDDPSALKDIIDIVQGKITSRTRFMVETLTNLKNNKLKRNTTQNQGSAAVERMKKFLSGLSKTKHVLAHEPLRVSLEDLHSSETKGKWWLVGAAWQGDPLVEKHDEFAKSTAAQAQEAIEMSSESADLIKLARSQGMNTDIRRGIFVVLMSSDDYVDACERLSQLNLTEIQQREIIRVILHCCGNERSYNPYYTLVCQQLCRTSHAYRITLQFSLWDFLRDLGETTVGGAAVIKNIKEDDGFNLKSVSDVRLQNVAKAYAWWIAKDCLTLMIFKPVDFTMLKPRAHGFLKELFTQVFINSQRATPLLTTDTQNITFTRNRNVIEEIFIKASRVQALAMGLVYFLSESFRDKSSSDQDLPKFLNWAIGVAKETLRTGVDLIPTL